jgi:hypothetical protein
MSTLHLFICIASPLTDYKRYTNVEAKVIMASFGDHDC